MQRRIFPGVAKGTIRAPSSKSYTHRALIAGYLTRDLYRVDNPLDSDDTETTRAGIEALGRRVVSRGTSWTLRPRKQSPSALKPVRIRCRRSGTSLRLLCAVAAVEGRPVVFEGSPELARRPMNDLWTALRTLGAEVSGLSARSSLPVRVLGPLRAGSVTVRADVSSQFISALLLALPVLEGESCLRLAGPVVSEPYIEATLAVLRAHRVSVERQGRRFCITGGQRYHGSRFNVPGDASSAAYLWTAAALTGGQVRVDGVPSRWPQADRKVLEVLRQAGAEVLERKESVTVTGGELRPFDCDLTDAPDLYPLLGTLASLIPATSRIRGAEQVVLKESDRRRATIALVRGFGGRARFRRRSLEVTGNARPRGIHLRGVSDHRVIMSAAVGALGAASASEVSDAACVSKSFPAFWEALEELGARSEKIR